MTWLSWPSINRTLILPFGFSTVAGSKQWLYITCKVPVYFTLPGMGYWNKGTGKTIRKTILHDIREYSIRLGQWTENVQRTIDRRSALYSSKPPAPMAQRASGGKRITFMQYGREWRALRNILHRLLTPAMSKSYSPIQVYEAKQFTNDLLDRPQDFYMHNRRYAASVIMWITYGHAIPVCTHQSCPR